MGSNNPGKTIMIVCQYMSSRQSGRLQIIAKESSTIVANNRTIFLEEAAPSKYAIWILD